MTTGEKIRTRRIQLGMTMDDLGNAIGVQKSAINKYEKNLIDLKQSTIVALSRALNVSILYLLDDDPNESLSDDDKELLSAYHAAEAGIQKSVRILLNLSEKDTEQSAI